jgi:hypothetical protein
LLYIFYGHLVKFVVIWYIFPVLVFCTKKNLATLLATHHHLERYEIDLDYFIGNKNKLLAIVSLSRRRHVCIFTYVYIHLYICINQRRHVFPINIPVCIHIMIKGWL